MKVIALLPGHYHDDVGAIVQLSALEVKILTSGEGRKLPAGLGVGAELDICDRVVGMRVFEERMKQGRAIGGMLRALAEAIDGSIASAESALVGPVEESQAEGVPLA